MRLNLRVAALCTVLFWGAMPGVPPVGAQTAAAEPLQAELDLLVFAPHPDDEVLGCAGVMLQAIEQGKRVGVVVLTNGAGFPQAASVITGKPLDQLTAKDFLTLAATRQQQSVEGLQILGVGTADLSFLGYPDSGLEPIYRSDSTTAYRQEFTEKSETFGPVVSDYHSLTHGRPAPYLRARALGDIAEIIKRSRPKEIYVTSEADTHADHRASFWYVRDAARTAGYGGVLFTYVVHGTEWPETAEHRVSLTSAQVEKKRTAIRAHQIPTVHDTLPEYAREEEVFWPIPTTDGSAAKGQTTGP